jgi:hypothetical protein
MTINDLTRMLLRGIQTPYAHRKLNHARLHMIHVYGGAQPMPESLAPLVEVIQTLERLKAVK